MPNYVTQSALLRLRWWNPLVGLGIFVGWFVAVLVIGVMLGIAAAAAGIVDISADTTPTDMVNEMSPGLFLFGNVLIASMLPTSLLAMRYGTGVAWKRTTSVFGGIRWGWLLWCCGGVSAILAPLFLVSTALDGELVVRTNGDTLAFLVIVLLTTPLQAAAEEYLCRGCVTLGVAHLVRRPVVGGIVGCAVATVLFVALHMSADPGVLLSLTGFSVAASYLTWKTGGLEAAIAFHIMNNVILLVIGVLNGSAANMLITEATSVPIWGALIDVATSAAVAAVLLWLYKWRQSRRDEAYASRSHFGAPLPAHAPPPPM